MKKLIFVFIALFTLTLVSGCGARQNTIRYNSESGSNTETTNTESTDIAEDTSKESEPAETNTEEETETDSEKEMEKAEVVKEVEVSKTPKTTSETSENKLSVTSLDGAFLKTNLSYNVIKGTAPEGTYKITINDYQLQKYAPGQKEWDYIASTKFSTLKSGLNNYVVKTFDAKGDQMDSLIFSIDYDAPAIPNLPGVGTSHWLTLMISLMLAGSYSIFRKLKCL